MGFFKWLEQSLKAIGGGRNKGSRLREKHRRMQSQRCCANCGYFQQGRCGLSGYVFSSRQLKRGAHRRRKCEDYEWNIWAE